MNTTARSWLGAVTGALLLASSTVSGTLNPLAADADPLNGPQLPTPHTRYLSQGASGGVCYDGPGGESRCRDFSISEWSDSTLGSVETRLSYYLYRYRSDPYLYAFRYMDCPVPSGSLKVTPNRAAFDASSDLSDPSCSNWGILCTDQGCDDWPWTGSVFVRGEMTDPGYVETFLNRYSMRDDDWGTSSRQQCQGGRTYSVRGGGVAFSLTGGNELYFPFSSTGASGEATGVYQYEMCNLLEK